MLWPNGSTSKPYVSSAFGPRNINVPNASKNHKGTDFSHTFTIIRAIAAGQVKVAGTPLGWSGGGTQVWVQHDGFFSKSLHAASLLVQSGQFVREGDPLCVMGRTGTASDVHLHLEITPGTVHFSNTGQVDPVSFISNRIGGPAGGGTTTPGGFLMALDDAKQQQIYDGVSALYAAIFGANGTLGSLPQAANLPTQIETIRQAVASLQTGQANTNAYLYAGGPGVDGTIGAPGSVFGRLVNAAGGSTVDVDEAALAAQLAPLLSANLGALSDADVARLAKAAADESDRRERERLGAES